MESKTERRKMWFYVLILALTAYTVKNFFVGTDVDEGYGIMVGYRLAKGDRLILEMWEPHQTSAIFTSLLIRLFWCFTGGNNNFLNLYLRAVYFIFQGAIAFYAECTLRRCLLLEKDEAVLLAMVFYVVSPKCIYIPEYSNLHVWFFAMLCFSLMRYYCGSSPWRGKTGYLFLAGVFLTGDVLSYPSMALVFLLCVVLILLRHVKTVIREILLFFLPCVLGAACFAGYILSYMSPSQVFNMLPYILGEGSHQTMGYGDKMLIYLVGFGEMVVFTLGISAVIAVLVTVLYRTVFPGRREKTGVAVCFLTVFFALLLTYQIYCWFTSDFNAGYPQLLHVALPLTGIYCYYKTGKKQETGFWLICFSLVSYLGVMLLSNWGPIFLNSYLYMGTVGGLLCLRTYLHESENGWRDGLWKGLCFLMVVCNVFGYCYLIIGGAQIHSSIFTVRGISRDGVRKGIFTSYMTSYEYNQNQEIWPEAVPDGSTVLYIGPAQFLYMLGDCTIASPNTISTYTYDESILDYWRIKPERYPDTVVVESWFGEERAMAQDSFIMQWLEDEFQALEVTDYSYITVYRK